MPPSEPFKLGRMEVTVERLTPGDEVQLEGKSAVHVAQCQHPIWPGLQMVIWRMADGTWHHDALDARQVVGTISAMDTPVERMARLRTVLLGHP